LEQLLELARQDAGSPHRPETIFLDTIAKQVAADLAAEASSKEIDLGFDVVETVPAKADPLMIASAIRNVLENAIKFTPRGGRVDLSTYRQDDLAVVHVEDSGPGILAKDFVSVFQPFVRGRHPTASGSGLGLSIVKRVVENHGGLIVVENVTQPNR